MSKNNPVTLTATALSDGTLGTASDALAEITSSYVEATQETTVSSLTLQINRLVADVTAILAALDTSHSRITS